SEFAKRVVGVCVARAIARRLLQRDVERLGQKAGAFVLQLLAAPGDPKVRQITGRLRLGDDAHDILVRCARMVGRCVDRDAVVQHDGALVLREREHWAALDLPAGRVPVCRVQQLPGVSRGGLVGVALPLLYTCVTTYPLYSL